MRWSALAALVCGLLYWAVVPPREPVYKGKKLSVWLQEFDSHSKNAPDFAGPDFTGARAAVLQAGEDAIPTLLRLLRAHDSAIGLKIYALLEKQKMIRFKHVQAEVLNAEAARGFLLLGSSASNAVPELIDIYEKKISVSSQSYTAASLGYIGPVARQAVPALLKGLSDTNWAVRRDAIWALGQIHEEPHSVVPALIKELEDTGKPPVKDAGIPNAVLAAQSLGAFGEDARRAVPSLMKMATVKTNAMASWHATEAIKKIDPVAAKSLEEAKR